MAAPTTAQLLETAKTAYGEALTGKSFQWNGRRYEFQDIGVLENAISSLERRLERESDTAPRRPIRVGF